MINHAGDAPIRDFALVRDPAAGVIPVVFHPPGVQHFTVLVRGLVAAPARRTVCGTLSASGMGAVWHHSRARRVLIAAEYCADPRFNRTPREIQAIRLAWTNAAA
jgi:hypothetical protein